MLSLTCRSDALTCPQLVAQDSQCLVTKPMGQRTAALTERTFGAFFGIILVGVY